VTARPVRATTPRPVEADASGSLPRPDQVLLLRAALLDDEPARAAWREWRSAVDLDAVDAASFRVLPLAWHNLQGSGVDDPGLERCRGIYRHTWSKNQLVLHRTAPALEALRAAGIPLLVLKGAALAHLVYPTPGTRPMNDVDVLVPACRAAEARAILEGAGWRPTLELPASAVPFLHALGYSDGAGAEIDLHWRALWEARPGAEDPFWAHARPLRLAGIDMSTLSPTDHLFHVAVHGLRWSEVPPIHWVADAGRILHSAPVDWDRLVALARRARLSLQLGEALEVLRDAIGLPIPDGAVDRLRALPSTAGERLEMWALGKPPSLTRGLWLHWCNHRRKSPGAGLGRRLRSFPVYLQAMWGIGNVWALPAEALGRAASRLRPGSGRSGSGLRAGL